MNRRRALFKLLNSSIPYYEELVSLIPNARVRPSIPEYPEIADHIRQAIDEVYYGIKESHLGLCHQTKEEQQISHK
jgi:multiple sugar transport system substrate-binding protein